MNITRYNLILNSLLLANSALAAPIASESFNYPHGTVLADGVAKGGSGWNGGWQKTTGDGLKVAGAQIVASNAESTRVLNAPFSLNTGVYYFSFLARANSAGIFAFQLKTELGQVRWAFMKNSDDSFTVQGDANPAVSAPGLFVEGGSRYRLCS